MSMKLPITERMMEDLARQALERCLATVPFASLEAAPSYKNEERGPDLLTRLRLPAGERLLLVEVKNNGEPRRAREALNQIFRYRERYPGAYGLFIAPYISPRAATLCEEEGVGYLDLAGNCRIAFDQIYIREGGHPNPYAQKRPLRSLYAPKAERVLRVLLTQPARRWKVQELAGEAGVSLGQAAKVKALLTDREWIATEAEGLTLRDPPALLNEWAENYQYRRSEIREFYSLQSVAEIENAIGTAGRETGMRYALTGFSGAARLAPFVRYQKAAAYVATAEELETLAERLGLKPVTSGANVSLLLPYDAGVFYAAQDREGVQITTPIQCYLDAQSLAGRGKEAAEAIWREALQPQWRTKT